MFSGNRNKLKRERERESTRAKRSVGWPFYTRCPFSQDLTDALTPLLEERKIFQKEGTTFAKSER